MLFIVYLFFFIAGVTLTAAFEAILSIDDKTDEQQDDDE